MRDKERIKDILERLEKIWNEYPDLRLGQLILNVYSDPTLYYVEDDKLLSAMESLYLKNED